MKGRMNVQNKDRLLSRLTGGLLSLAAADAAYVLWIVMKMTECTELAAERYYAVPAMLEHILAAVVLTLGGVLLLHKASEQ